MSRFKNRFKKRSTTQREETAQLVGGRQGRRTPRLREEGPMTESSYLCWILPCEGRTFDDDGNEVSCTETILNVIDPVPDVVIGDEHACPMELVFTHHDFEVQEGVVEEWAENRFAGDRVAHIRCSECGHDNRYLFSNDGGMVIEVIDAERVEIPIPQSRLPYRKNPLSNWDVVNTNS